MSLASHALVTFIVFCFMWTEILSQSSTAPVVSLEGPTIYAVLNRKKVISCTVTDSTGTAVTVTWQKNSVMLTNSVNSGYIWNSTPANNHADLTIQNVQQGDEAIFTCVAQNGLRGKSEFSIEMILIGTPNISLTIADDVSQVAVGGTTTLQCNINGSENTLANTNIRWQGPSGEMLTSGNFWIRNGSRTSELILTSLTSNHSGIYICTASNIAGNATSNTVLLTVIDDLSVTILENRTYVITGQSKSIECQVTGSSISSVTWSSNGVSLTVGSKYSWTYNNVSGRTDLVVYNLTKADAGEYKCSAENTVKRSTHDTIDLTVEDVLSVNVGSITNGILGQNKTIPCAIIGTPVITVQWLHNENQLSTNSQYRWNTGAMADLYIYFLTSDSIGTYTCWGVNHVSTSQDSVYLNIISPSSVKILSGNSTGNSTFGIVGQSKTIVCQVSGTSVSTVSWHFYNTPLSISPQYKWRQELTSGDVNLTISALLKSDSGKYTCSATNAAGTVSDSVDLSAEARPVATIESTKDLSAHEGENVLITCVITNTTTIDSLQWYFQNRFLCLSDPHYYWPFNGSLGIYNVTSQDTGIYKCQATNAAGTGEDVIALSVIVRNSDGSEATDIRRQEDSNVNGPNVPAIILAVLFGISVVVNVILSMQIIGIWTRIWKRSKTEKETQRQQVRIVMGRV